MFESARPLSILYQCDDAEDYYSIVESGRDPDNPYQVNGCGNSFSITFHILFQIIVSNIFLNLFIAIIIDAFMGQADAGSMPIVENVLLDFQQKWRQHDRLATGFITIEQLDLLIIDLANSNQKEGGALIVDRKRMIDNMEYRARQIRLLELPTFDGMKHVMFWDVMMMLCSQIVKIHHKKANLEKLHKQLKVVKMFGGNKGIADNTLDQLHNKNVKKQDFEVDFGKLLAQMADFNTKIELVKEMIGYQQALKKKYNLLVDTNYKILGDLKLKELADHGIDIPVELMTTLQIGSASLIC